MESLKNKERERKQASKQAVSGYLSKWLNQKRYHCWLWISKVEKSNKKMTIRKPDATLQERSHWPPAILLAQYLEGIGKCLKTITLNIPFSCNRMGSKGTLFSQKNLNGNSETLNIKTLNKNASHLDTLNANRASRNRIQI